MSKLEACRGAGDTGRVTHIVGLKAQAAAGDHQIDNDLIGREGPQDVRGVRAHSSDGPSSRELHGSASMGPYSLTRSVCQYHMLSRPEQMQEHVERHSRCLLHTQHVAS